MPNSFSLLDTLHREDQQLIYDWFLCALCVWREARGETREAKIGVASVIANRARHPAWWGSGFHAVIIKPYQFSSFNKNDPNAVKFPNPDDSSWVESLEVTRGVMTGTIVDPTDGSTHYYDSSISPPEWAIHMTATTKIGRLNFFK